MHQRTGRREVRSALAAGLGAAAVAAGTAGGPGRAIDRTLYRALDGAGGRVPHAVSTGITELGSIWGSVGAALGLSLWGRRREALDAVAAAVAAWGAGQVLKRVVRRPRPWAAVPEARLLIHRPNGTAWPSSHPAVLLAFLTVAARDLELGRATRSLLAGLAVLVGISRVHVGVHYPADVAGGLLLGRAVADLWGAGLSPRLTATPARA